MPKRIIGQSDHVKILSALHVMIKPVTVQLVIRPLIQMDHNRKIGVHCTHGADTCADKSRNIIVFRLFPVGPEQAVRHLIADLDHGRERVFFFECQKHAAGIIINRLFQLVVVIASPCLRLHLLSGIRPKIAVMKIKQKLHPLRKRSLCGPYRNRQIIRSGAVRLLGLCVRVVPQTQTHGVRSIAL